MINSPKLQIIDLNLLLSEGQILQQIKTKIDLKITYLMSSNNLSSLLGLNIGKTLTCTQPRSEVQINP